MIHLSNTKKILPAALFMLLIILWGITIVNVDKLTRKNNALETELQSVNQAFTTSKNKYNEEIAKQDVLLTANRKYTNSLINEITWGSDNKIKSKNVSVVIKEKIVTELDTQFIYLQDTTLKDTNYIRVPNSFFTSNPHYTIKGKVLKDRINFEKISFSNTVTTVISKERYNLFYNKQVVHVHMSNPYSSIKELKSVVIKKEPNKLLKNGTRVVLFLGGFYLGTRL